MYKPSNNKVQTASEEKSKKIERYRPGKAPAFSEQEIAVLPLQNSLSTRNLSNTFQISLPEIRSLPDPDPAPSMQIQDTDSAPAIPVSKPPATPSPPTSPQIRAKPTFVAKSSRATHKQREQQEKEELQLLNDLKKIQEEKKNRTQVIVAQVNTVEQLKDLDSDPESSSSEDPDFFTLWKIREVKRIVRDKEAREVQQREAAEIERRRNLTDWERQEEDKKLGNDESAKPVKQKIQFMQKYYSKGVYFQERDQNGKLKEIFMRDYNAPVEGDHDKSTLPAILQKRRGEFGKKDQSKYTHLSNEDTTNFDPMYMPQTELLIKQQMKGAGYKSMNSFDAKGKKST